MTGRALARLLLFVTAVVAASAAHPAVAQVMPPPPEGPTPEVKPPPAPPPAEPPAPPPSPPVVPLPPLPPAVPQQPDTSMPLPDEEPDGPETPQAWEKRPTKRLQSRWRSVLYGFVEVNAMRDSTESYGPSSNNVMLARPGTYAGQHGRTQMTANNSLIGVLLEARPYDGLYANGHAELDFFGAQPTDATEQTIYTTPSVRMRLFYLRLKAKVGRDSSLDLLAGQYHDLFAWGGAGFYPHSVAFLGIAGQVYHRQPQLRLTWSVPLCCVTIDVAAAAVRPVQRDSEVPDAQAGLRVSVNRWRGIGAQGFGQPDLLPAAIGVSGVWRRFAVAEFLPVPGEPKVGFGYGFAANAFVPVIPARSAWDRMNALSLNAEVTVGTGISDLYTGLTGGALFPSLPNPAGLMPAPIYRQNIDSGIVTFDADGNLKPINWRALVVGFQYYLPVVDGRIWVSANYSQLKSTNIVSLTPENSRGGVFYWQQYFDANLYAALTPAVQAGLSYQYTEQVFGDRPFSGRPGGGEHPRSHNHRGELGLRFFF
jgi:hypothetical protein